MSTIYCLVPSEYWQQFAERRDYVPRDYDEEGFIHATKGEDLVERVANRVYPDFEQELLLLVIDESQVTAPILYERAKDGLLYPHIYGHLNKEAISDIRKMRKAAGAWQIGESCCAP
ncbi:DUF952 domain-containing protein [Brevibacillus fulvus]|uniref:Uncharacterized protein (DUF952 family) n=1 Tax=Brevibacillus fulvus TaxID=1125967 RepID=A0A939BR39_9BACL|nr:DUF952 domain-containing protein [Brevibacillus fulvus]MBM7589068.1 uncharacterized protein (DUF952 family) [Brevibacillus fulvus]